MSFVTGKETQLFLCSSFFFKNIEQLSNGGGGLKYLVFFFFYRKTGKTKKGKKQQEKVIAKGSIKYNALKLYEKGVVLEMEGLPQAQ